MGCRQQVEKRLIGHSFNHLPHLPELIFPMIQKNSDDKNEGTLYKCVHTDCVYCGSQLDRGRSTTHLESVKKSVIRNVNISAMP